MRITKQKQALKEKKAEHKRREKRVRRYFPLFFYRRCYNCDDRVKWEWMWKIFGPFLDFGRLHLYLCAPCGLKLLKEGEKKPVRYANLVYEDWLNYLYRDR